MGAGKTTIGKILAKRLQWTFTDTDHITEYELGMSLTAVFADLGELWFRQYEKKVLQKTTTLQNTIISTGGGTPCYEDNMDTIIQNGLCIYLYLPPKAIISRLAQSKKPRPLVRELSGIELETYVDKTLAERENFYSKAHFTVDALSPNLVQIVESRIREHFGL
jgi:shikimate kinase